MDWSKLPDIFAVALLATAFASVARHNKTRISGIWLTGWLLIVLHFIAFMFLPAAGVWGVIASAVGVGSLTWTGLLFMWASVPYREKSSSRWMVSILLSVTTLYLFALIASGPDWLLDVTAIVLAVGPLALTLATLRELNHPLRWTTVLLYATLSLFLLSVQHRPGNGPDLALNGVLFTVYFDCCIHFWYMYRKGTAGAFITIYGFFTWAFVFVIAPLRDAFYPAVHIENEVWNLPKYVVAVGMILLLLEEQIEHNKHLALHDVLTGLPNRRLFQDRLSGALERARRTGARTALLVLDLDRFKQVNDTLGHHVGDLLLQQVANVFSGRVRRSDTVARTGGDEFSVILEGPTNEAEALSVGRSLQNLLNEPMLLDNRNVKIGVSIGVAIFPDDAADGQSLCIAADMRMYDNKNKGAAQDDPRYSKSKIPGPPQQAKSDDGAERPQ